MSHWLSHYNFENQATINIKNFNQLKICPMILFVSTILLSFSESTHSWSHGGLENWKEITDFIETIKLIYVVLKWLLKLARLYLGARGWCYSLILVSSVLELELKIANVPISKFLFFKSRCPWHLTLTL